MMLNGLYALAWAAVILGAVYWIPRAIRMDRADEYHLLHGPKSNCVECESK